MSATDSEAELSLELKSRLGGSVQSLNLLEQSLLFAELSSISYYNERFVRPIVSQLGFDELNYFERDGAQAYIFASLHDTVVACRGTEPNEWNDIRADANAVAAVAETVGKVHSGFKQEVDDLWPELEAALQTNTRTLWFTGHSLGGAMATIAAGRCFLSHIPSMPAGLFTYGSPRVGDKRYVNYCDINHIRWVNNNDLVTRLPPAWLGFRHGGREMYLDSRGRLRRLRGWARFVDGLRGFGQGLRRLRIDHLSDHSVDAYIDAICGCLQADPATSHKVSEPGPGPGVRQQAVATPSARRGRESSELTGPSDGTDCRTT